MSANIYGPARSRKFFTAHVGTAASLRREIFYLAYHLHWSYSEIVAMPSDERQSFVRLLAEEIERQNREMEEAAKKR